MNTSRPKLEVSARIKKARPLAPLVAATARFAVRFPLASLAGRSALILPLVAIGVTECDSAGPPAFSSLRSQNTMATVLDLRFAQPLRGHQFVWRAGAGGPSPSFRRTRVAQPRPCLRQGLGLARRGASLAARARMFVRATARMRFECANAQPPRFAVRGFSLGSRSASPP